MAMLILARAMGAITRLWPIHIPRLQGLVISIHSAMGRYPSSFALCNLVLREVEKGHDRTRTCHRFFHACDVSTLLANGVRGTVSQQYGVHSEYMRSTNPEDMHAGYSMVLSQGMRPFRGGTRACGNRECHLKYAVARSSDARWLEYRDLYNVQLHCHGSSHALLPHHLKVLGGSLE